MRWCGSIRLSPPLLTGEIATERGERWHDDVTGLVTGRRADLFDVAARKISPAPLRWMGNAAAGVLGPWASLVVGFGENWAGVRFHVDGSWKNMDLPVPVLVADLDQALIPWLRQFLDEAASRLGAHAPDVASVPTAWEKAGLHLVFDEREATEAEVLRSVELIRSAGVVVGDRAAGRRLLTRLEAFRLDAVAAQLRAVLDDR